MFGRWGYFVGERLFALLRKVLANVAASGRLSAIVSKFKPAVILISGCQDNQTSMDGDHNGAFTEQLLKVWNDGAFSGSYSQRVRILNGP